MRLLFSAVLIGSVSWVGVTPAVAGSPGFPGFGGPLMGSAPLEEVGWRRNYWRYGYPAPYAYYPPAYGGYPPPAAYAYPPPAYGDAVPPYPGYAYRPPVYGNQPPPAADDGNYPAAGDQYGDDYPPEGNYPPAEGDNGDYPANGS
jgi:hypothetical protein